MFDIETGLTEQLVGVWLQRGLNKNCPDLQQYQCTDISSENARPGVDTLVPFTSAELLLRIDFIRGWLVEKNWTSFS